MTESFRRSGEYPLDGQAPYQQSASVYPGQQGSSYEPTAAGAYSGPPAPPAPPVYDPPAYDPPVYDPSAYDPTAYGPTADAPPMGFPPMAAEMAGAGARRGRARTPFALLVAVALIAGVVGGGTAFAVHQLAGQQDSTSSAAVSGTPVSKQSRGTIAGVAAAVSPSIVEVSATMDGGQSTGSGVIVTSNGEIVTNNHVIAGATSIKAQTSNGKTYTAKVVGTDPNKDLALIKLSGAAGLKTATLGNSAGIQVGDDVVAIGSPEGLTGTVTSGIISALDRDVTVPVEDQQGGQESPWGQGGDGSWPFEFGGKQFNGDTGSSKTTYKAIQTDASLNPGNSGGALINMAGQIVGINSAMYSPSSADSSSSSAAGSVGLGFAIPINTVRSDLAQLRGGGTNT